MLPNAPKYVQMVSKTPKYTQNYLNATKCIQMLPDAMLDVTHGICSHAHARKCFQMLANASKYLQMLLNATKLFQTHPTARKCFQS